MHAQTLGTPGYEARSSLDNRLHVRNLWIPDRLGMVAGGGMDMYYNIYMYPALLYS